MQQFRRWKNITGEYYLEPNKLCPKEDIENDFLKTCLFQTLKKRAHKTKQGRG